MKTRELVLVRHGESKWNYENKFTGWTDVELTERGFEEAKEAGKSLKKAGYFFDYAYTSVLKRAIHTLWKILDELDQSWLPTKKSWRLNERHYGALQGLNKEETMKIYGNEQVKQWRRSLSKIPPTITNVDIRFPGKDRRYSHLKEDQIPIGESLSLTINRVLPYWKREISVKIKNGKKVILVAHGNSIRALIVILENIKEEEILELNIPTGTPIVYKLDENMEVIKSFFLDLQK